ncbi:hypothetical protein [Actinophytocola sediminis]
MRAIFWLAVVSILIGIALVLTGYRPGTGYGPHVVCTTGAGAQMKCKESDR